MKKIVSLCVTCLLAVSACLSVYSLSYGEEHEGDYGSRQQVYTDVPTNHWAYEETKRCKETGWFQGYPDGSFRPDAPITREEAIKVFVEFLGRELHVVTKSKYHDVAANRWSAPYIHAGEDLFPPKWKNSNAFQPTMPVTREDTVYALVKALNCDAVIPYPDESLLFMFKDKNSISDAMSPYVAIALEEELVSGYEDDTIRAQDPLTRAQFSALLYRASFHGTHSPEVVAEGVDISPSGQQNLTVGDSITFKAKMIYSDGSKVDIDDIKPYDSDYSNVVRISGNTVTAIKEGRCVIRFNYENIDDAVTIIVSNPDDSPEIDLDFDRYTEEEYVEIIGEVTDKTDTKVEVTCNGDYVSVRNGSFSYEARLTVGKNTFTFTAKNGYGNTTTQTITIERTESEPETTEMLNVVGMTESNATRMLEKLGLQVETETVWDENVAQGTVVAQSVEEGREIEIGKTVTITVSGGKNEWVGWTDSLPSYVNGKDYIVEEKTQYRKKELEVSTGSSPSKSGWTLENQTESWGGWSGWSRTPVSASSTREVNTKQVADPQQYKTQWHYTRYYGWNASKGAYVSWPWKGTHSTIYQESGWRDTPMENRGKGDGVNATVYRDTSDSISVWWWNETTRQTALPLTYHTEYQYRDKTVTYHFSRWSDWSEWKDGETNGNSEMQVETRVLYRYKFK